MTDAVVIGGGHNGLTAAGSLAKAGMSVVVLEKRKELGGLAATYEFAPGFRASIGPDLAGLLSPMVIEDLGLKKHGLELVPLDPIVTTPEGLMLWRDVGKSVEAIRKFSTKDASAYPRFIELVDKLAAFLKPLLTKPAPTPDVQSGSDLLELLKLGWGFRQLGQRPMHELLRILPMAISDFFDEWFENDLLKAALAGPALEGVCLGPRSAGTAALFLYQRLGNQPAIARNLPGALSAALSAFGGKVRTEAAVSKIRVEDGRVQGVELENGETIDAPRVLSTVSPRTTFLELAHPSDFDPSFISEIENIRYRGVTAKLDLALSEKPDVQGVLQIGPSLDYLERAYDAVKYGDASDAPILRAVVRSAAEPGLAPDGKHVMSVLVQYVPYGTTLSPEKVIDALGLGDSVLHHSMRTPEGYESELGLPEGNLHHGEMALDQLFFMRPVPGWSRYETPVEGLYLGGAGSHPGGGITGAPGANSARALLKSRAPRIFGS